MQRSRYLYGGMAITVVVLLMALLLALAGGGQSVQIQDISHLSGPLDITGAGTAALPALYFAGDVDTGIYQPSANNWGIAAAGAQVLNVSAAGLDMKNLPAVNVGAASTDFTTAGLSTAYVTATTHLEADVTVNADGAVTFNSTLDVDGAISSGTGAITLTDASGVVITTGPLTLSDGDVVVADDLRVTAQTAITVTDAGAFAPTGTYQRIQAAGEVTPTITVGTAGDLLVLINTSAQTINIADTGIQMLSAAWAGGQYDTLTLWCDGTNWLEISRSNN